MSDNNFRDPVDELIARHNETLFGSDANTTDDVEIAESKEVYTEPVLSQDDFEFDEDDYDDNDVNYGDDDLEDEIREEEEREANERAAAIEEYERAQAEAAKKMTEGAPNPHDMKKTAADINFQTENLAVVSMMVNKVIAKNHITSGCIPEDKKMQVMGDLMERYYLDGDVITPEFEQIVLDNWIGANTNNDPIESKPETSNNKVEELVPEKNDTVININVEKGTPVTVNIDGDTLAQQTTTQEINVVVHEISKDEMRVATIIENSELDGIITPYESSSTDVPLTLPMSAYRCTMSGVSLYDMIKLSSIQNENPRDADIKTWSLIYDHLKNPSIGKFKSFEDFLKHTDYRDMELLLWGSFVSSADETETLHFTCGNEKCKHEEDIKYSPRSLVHVDEEYIPEHYNKTHSVPSGIEAVKHWEDVHSKIKIYELPDSKVQIELDDFSAWDYHNIKMPIMENVYKRYRPNARSYMSESLTEAEQAEMEFTLMFLLYVKSATIMKNGKAYKYTHWDDIEKITKTHISNKDLSILVAIINKVRNTRSPIAFYLENVVCPACGHTDERVPVDDLMRSLFFNLSRGLSSTMINFVEQGKI